MPQRKSHHSAFQVYADVLMCMLGVVLVMTSLLLISIKVKSDTGKSDPKAEYLITLTWDDERDVDLDLWVRTPSGGIVFYNNREDKNVSLDRDSRGAASNETTLDNGITVTSSNREVTSIRAIIPGDYLVSVGYYAGGAAGVGYGSGAGAPEIDFLVQIEKVNPRLTPLFGQKFHMEHIKQSIDVAFFHIDEDGKVTILPIPAGDSLIQGHGGG